MQFPRGVSVIRAFCQENEQARYMESGVVDASDLHMNARRHICFEEGASRFVVERAKHVAK